MIRAQGIQCMEGRILEQEWELGVVIQRRRAGLSVSLARELIRQRLRPERGVKSPRESERGWGPASIEKCFREARGTHDRF